jgi:hypothetical protein
MDIPKPAKKITDASQSRSHCLVLCAKVLEDSSHDSTDDRSTNGLGRRLFTLPHTLDDKGRQTKVITHACAFVLALCPFRSIVSDVC